MVVSHKNWFAVARGVEGVAQILQLFTQLNVVVDFAVEGHGVAIRLAFWTPLKWLVGMCDIDNGEAIEAKHRVCVMP